MTILALLPLKALDRAKTRLAASVAPDARRALVFAMAQHVIEVVSLRADRVVLVTDSSLPEFTDVEQIGVGVIGLNLALQAARAALYRDGSLLVVAPDLPNLALADLDRLIGASDNGVAIAPDLAGDGTNAIAYRGDLKFPFCFGPASLDRHRRAALAIGMTPRVVRTEGLGFDVDSVASLLRWKDVA